MARIAGVITACILALPLTACGGNGGQTGAAGSTSTPTKTPAAKALPDKPVCSVFSGKDVSRIIGVPIHSADDIDLLAGAQPTICNYYVDADKIKSVGIQWMTIEDALWDDQVAAIDTTPNPTPADMDTVRSRVAGLGDDAIKEVVMNDDEKTVGYMVLLKDRGMVLYVSNTAQVPDTAQVELTKAAIRAALKL
jgi:hypothetical protein